MNESHVVCIDILSWLQARTEIDATWNPKLREEVLWGLIIKYTRFWILSNQNGH